MIETLRWLLDGLVNLLTTWVLLSLLGLVVWAVLKALGIKIGGDDD